MKRIISFLIILTLPFISVAQTSEGSSNIKPQASDSLQGWESGGLISLNMSQVSLTNWNAGGQNSLSLIALLSLHANLTKGKSSWENSLDLGYGVLGQGRKDFDWIKTDDKINLVSKYGYQATEKWYYSGLLNFSTQATNGYNYPNDSVPISRFMAPGYLLLAAGFDYKPNKIFSAFISPATMKSTFVLDQKLADAGAFGVEALKTDALGNITPGKNSRFEIGGYVRIVFQNEIIKHVNLSSKLDLYANYIDNPGRIDVNWENLISFKVNKFISATISTHLIYDDDIDIVEFDESGQQIAKGPRVQFKEVLSIGFSYDF